METILIILSILIAAILVIIIVIFLLWLFGDSKFKKIAEVTILYVSDCDGMCEHCNEELKEICDKRKDKCKQ